MVSRGDKASYQLSGTDGSISSASSIWEELDGHKSSPPPGQHYHSDIYQVEGRHYIHSAVPVSNHPVDLVHFKELHDHFRTPSKSSQHDSRPGALIISGPGVSVILRLLQLDAEPNGVSENNRKIGSIGGGLVRLSPHQTASFVLQLESRPRGSSNKCIHAGLVKTMGLYQSTLVPDSLLSVQGEVAVCKSGVNNSSVENPIMVSSSSGCPGGLPSSSTNSIRDGNDTNRTGVSNETRSTPN